MGRQHRQQIHLILLLGAFYGAAAFTVYTLCVAHANDLVHKKRAVEVSSGLLLVFSMGAVLGPLIASLHDARAAAPAPCSCTPPWLTWASRLVMILRVAQRPKLPIERNEPFVSVPKTTPAVFDLDPRGERQGTSTARSRRRPAAGSAAAAPGLPPPPLLPRRSNA